MTKTNYLIFKYLLITSTCCSDVSFPKHVKTVKKKYSFTVRKNCEAAPLFCFYFYASNKLICVLAIIAPYIRKVLEH